MAVLTMLAVANLAGARGAAPFPIAASLRQVRWYPVAMQVEVVRLLLNFARSGG